MLMSPSSLSASDLQGRDTESGQGSGNGTLTHSEIVFRNRVEGQKNRFTFTDAHNAVLEKAFEGSPYPTKNMKIQLSQIVGCTEVQVQNWFSRRRTRAALELQEKKEKQAALEKLDKDMMDKTSTSGVPISSTPTTSTATSSIPTSITLASSIPASIVPASSAPSGITPISPGPTSGAPASSSPITQPTFVNVDQGSTPTAVVSPSKELAQSPTTPNDDKGLLDAMAVTGTGSTTTPKPAATITKKSRPEFKSEPRAAIEVKLEPQTLEAREVLSWIARITRGNGLVNPEYVKFAVQLMEGAKDYDGRKYILNAFLSTRSQSVLQEFVKSKGPSVFRTWMLEAKSSGDSSDSKDLLLKSIDFLARLSFDYKTLKECKLGKVVKKLATDDGVDQEIAREAQQLMDKWVDDLSGAVSTTPSSGTTTTTKADSVQKSRKRERDEGPQEMQKTKSSDIPLPKFIKGASAAQVETVKKPNIVENVGFFDELKSSGSTASNKASISASKASSSSLSPVKIQALAAPEKLASPPVATPTTTATTTITTTATTTTPSSAAAAAAAISSAAAAILASASAIGIQVSSPTQPSHPSPITNGLNSPATPTTTITPTLPVPMEIEDEISKSRVTPGEVTPVTDSVTNGTTTTTTVAESSDAATDDTVAPPSKKRKVVRFKAEHELVSIRLIEPRGFYPEENNEDDGTGGGAGGNEYNMDHPGQRPFLLGMGSMEVNHDGYGYGNDDSSNRWNARPQFVLPDQMIEALVRGDMWTPPSELSESSGRAGRGSKSTEKDVQEKREAETLSVYYRQIAYIPPSPAEPDPEPLSAIAAMLGGQTPNGAAGSGAGTGAGAEKSNEASSVWEALSAAVAAAKSTSANSTAGGTATVQATALLNTLAGYNGYVQQQQQQQQQQYQAYAAMYGGYTQPTAGQTYANAYQSQQQPAATGGNEPTPAADRTKALLDMLQQTTQDQQPGYQQQQAYYAAYQQALQQQPQGNQQGNQQGGQQGTQQAYNYAAYYQNLYQS